MICLVHALVLSRVWVLTLALVFIFVAGIGRSVAEDSKIGRAELRSQIQRFALRYSQQLSQDIDDAVIGVKSPKLRLDLLGQRTDISVNAFHIALGPYPDVNLMDLLVFVSLERAVIQEYWVPKVLKKNGTKLLATSRQLESEAWQIGAKLLSDQQRQELRRLIRDWRARNPDLVYVEGIRFGDFADQFEASSLVKASRPGFLLPEVGEAVVVLDEVRVFSERLLFYVQALPGILHAYTSLTLLGALAEPSTQRLLADANRVSREVKRFNDTLADAVGLVSGPALERTAVGAERASQEFGRFNDTFAEAVGLMSGPALERTAVGAERASQQFVRFNDTFAEAVGLLSAPALERTAVGAERASQQFARFNDTFERATGLFTGWPEGDAANAPARVVLADVRETLDSSKQLATTVNTTMASVERTVAQIDGTIDKLVAIIPEEPEERADERRDLQQLMIETAATAGKIEGLLLTFDKLLVAVDDQEVPPAVVRIIERVDRDASGWIEQGFVYGLILILVFMASGVIAMLTYRFLHFKLFAV